MKLTRRFSFYLTAAAIMLAAFSAAAQTSRPDFNRTSSYDVQNYTIHARFDRAGKKVFGDTTVSLKPLKAGFTSVELDAVGLAFSSVTLDPSGTTLKYRTMPGKVIVALDKPYSPDDIISIRFKYTTTEPKKGVYFVDEEKDSGHSAQIWSQGEAEEARYWFPSFDFPSDKATTEEYITAQSDEVVVGNGELLGKTNESDGTVTWHYKMPVPHSTYLVSFVIGKYVRVDDKYGDIPLGFYVYPGKEDTARKAFGATKDMIRVYEGLTGVKFPYNKYDQTLVAHFQFGGMENITATTMADTEIFFADFGAAAGEGIVTDLVSHELAHSWFGDMVTCRNWAELWLNEGFATYMEAAYREKAFGRDNYIQKVRSDAGMFLAADAVSHQNYGLFNRRARNVDSLFEDSSVTYNKGGAVLHQLREQVGTEAFWKALNAYLTAHRFGNVESTDLEKAMEEASGQDLKWFFDQWVYGVGAPQITVHPVYNARLKTLKLTLTQTQPAAPLVPAVFRMAFKIGIDTAAESQPVTLTKRTETVTVKVTGKPTEITLDPEDKIVLKTVKMLPIQVLR